MEISKTDAINLGINPTIRESGNLNGGASIFIASEKAVVKRTKSVIIAKPHIRMTPDGAIRLNVKDKDKVCVIVKSNRPVIFEDVIVRVNENYKLSMHIDYDEANAVGFEKGMVIESILKGKRIICIEEGLLPNLILKNYG
ncbi:PduL/EutD family phosphate acyltransferase [Schnuerera ultunensis]|uniref:Phosphate propanoyltransferase n=1 Tax=[Clostridium] ultunense Esp TaxID=1288971 RepID=A0A1M4PPF1_9FIRM|nr:PduL/EutD family phosphate acyltransferase [Schnuerera ultunensis]SHD77348.1 protein of unknown function [[Clostridium] ultunense Esp]